MEEKGKIDKAKQEYRQGEEKLDQERHKLSRLKMRAKYQKSRHRAEYDPEYAARTHRLCIKGGVIEHFYPETMDMTEPEFYQLMDCRPAHQRRRQARCYRRYGPHHGLQGHHPF